MASAVPRTPSSMRQVRDKYLNILLTGGTPAPAPSAPPPAGWTPGHSFGVSQPWTSPVTPAPSENDVRMAELAAGLVAAGGVEARQTDTIRRLAEQLDNSEKRLRTLEADATRRRRSALDDGEKLARKSSTHNTNRHLRFTPARHSSPRDGARNSTGRSSKRRTAFRSDHVDDADLLAELEVLRKERKEWELARKRSEREAASLSQMMVDIKQNTKRLVEEREDHLKVIGSLREELAAAKREMCAREEFPVHDEREDRVKEISRLRDELATAKQEIRAMQEPAIPAAAPPVPNQDASPLSTFHLSDKYGNGTRLFEDVREDPSPSVRQLNFDSEIRGGFGDDHEQFDSPTPEDRERIEEDLREELRLVLSENEKLSERVPQLEAECLDLSRKLRNAEKEIMRRPKDEDIGNNSKQEPFEAQEERVQSISEVAEQLLDELQILEGVSDAINFRVSPLEVEELQATMTALSITEENTSQKGPEFSMARKRCSDVCNKTALERSVNKIMCIRESLSLRYGQWLRAVAADDSTTTVTAISRSTDEAESVDSIDTEAIDKLIPDTVQ